MTLLWEAARESSMKKDGKPTVVQPISSRLRGMQSPDRCTATTRIGRRCRCRKAQGSEFCCFHDPVISAQIREKAQAKREAKKRELSSLPEGYLKTLTSMDGISSALDRLYREVRLGIVSPRTAGIMLAIVDRLLEHDKLVSSGGQRRTSKKLRAKEVRKEVGVALDDLKQRSAQPLKVPASVSRPAVKTMSNSAPSTQPLLG